MLPLDLDETHKWIKKKEEKKKSMKSAKIWHAQQLFLLTFTLITPAVNSYLWHVLIRHCLVVLKAYLADGHGALEEESQWELGHLSLDQGVDSL